MTLGAAIRCDKGVVLCADSQESVGDYQYPVEKLVTHWGPCEAIAIIGSGRAGLVDMIAEELVGNLEGGYDALSDYKRIVKGTLTELYKNEIAAYPAPLEEKHVDLIVAVKPTDSPDGLLLLKCEGTAVSSIKWFEVIGAGRAVRYELESIYRRRFMTLRQGVVAAIHILRVASTALHIVGGTGSIATMTYDGRLAVEPEWNVAQTDSFLWGVRRRIGQIMLHVGDGTMSSEEFAKAVTEFTDEATRAHEQMIGVVEFMARIEALANPVAKPSVSQSPEPGP